MFPLEVVKLVAVDFSYKPSEIYIKKGTPTKVTFKNEGNVEHDFELVSDEDILIQTTSSTNHQHGKTAAKKVHLHAKPGETATVVLKATAAGTYQFYCTIPGHKESGMVGRITFL
ncbi:cupredoxin domain-containing protein [Brevibacillus sp. SAFN-007a]|uniref:cupredoxin domain-containing protein n=1 Tax=Brevibacillus sp. SAFN-007a TaxID=3436862 RepID=UPI003F7F4FF6